MLLLPQAVAANPASVKAWYRLALACCGLNREAQALAALRAAIHLQPGHPQLLDLARCLGAADSADTGQPRVILAHQARQKLWLARSDEEAALHALEVTRQTVADAATRSRANADRRARARFMDGTRSENGPSSVLVIKEWLVQLGLPLCLDSVTSTDVRRAYLRRLAAVHPDKGGSAQQFAATQDAYYALMELLRSRSGDTR